MSTINKYDNLVGATAIIASNIFLIAGSWLLKETVKSNNLPVTTFCFCNLIASIPLITSIRRSDFLTNFKNINIVFWALSYSATYICFVKFPKQISVSHLMIAEALAPIIVLFFRAKWRSDFGLQLALKTIIPIICLLGLLMTIDLNNLKLSQCVITASLILFFCISQYNARIVSQTNRVDLQVILTFFSFILTFPFSVVELHRFNNFNQVSLFKCALIGISIILVQRLFILGLKKTKTLFAALLISTSVPLSLIFTFIFSTKSTSIIQLSLSCLFCIAVFLAEVKWFQNKSVGSDHQL